jgi:tetrahydromethanopterin S-methyltransferase subunit G
MTSAKGKESSQQKRLKKAKRSLASIERKVEGFVPEVQQPVGSGQGWVSTHLS